MVFCLLCVLAICVLEADCVVPFSSIGCLKTPNCPLFNPGPSIVTVENLQQEVNNGVWAMIYYSEFDSKQTYGKCNFEWTATDENNEVLRQQFACFNLETQECETVDRNLTRKVDDCGGAEENGANGVLDSKFYSQDILNYFWYDSCLEFNDAKECTFRFLNLMVRKTRVQIEPPTFEAVPSYSNRYDKRSMYQPARQYRLRTAPKQVLNLQWLPWDLISLDVKNIFDLDFGNDFIKFSWKGPECDFDGNVLPGTYTFY